MWRDAGVIPIVKGNLPQIAFALHSDSKLWGRCMNPFNKDRSCGGSSGGDAGLIAARCVPLSLGADIGGSIRIPASFNGVFGFKCTPERASMEGCRNILKDSFVPSQFIRLIMGPFGRSVEDVKLGFSMMIPPNINDYDHTVPPLPFNEEAYK